MEDKKKIVVELSDDGKGNILSTLESIFANTVKPDLVFLKLSQIEYPRRTLDLPKELLEYVAKNPQVKFIWDGNNPLKDDQNYEVILFTPENIKTVLNKVHNPQFVEHNHKYLDMTLITCHHGGTVNQLRKSAMNKAIMNWFMQKHLPSQIIFLELVIDDDAAFSQSDFPSDIQYIRISGNKNNKSIFQKECLWNIGLKLSANEKIMFLDYDTSPIGDCDWFKKVYDELDKSLFTQGFRRIMYLDDNGQITLNKNTITYDIVNEVQKSNNPVPGGAFCIAKSTLETIGGFNRTCFYGGGDNLFFNEILDEKSKQRAKNISVSILGRKNVHRKMLEMSVQTGKSIIGSVDVDTFHFYHGNLSNRSYGVRTYLALMMFPFSNYFFVDDIGLLTWKTTNTKLYDMFGNIEGINDSMKIANQMLGNDVNLNDWKCAIDRIQNNFYVNKNIAIVKRMLIDAKRKFGV